MCEKRDASRRGQGSPFHHDKLQVQDEKRAQQICRLLIAFRIQKIRPPFLLGKSIQRQLVSAVRSAVIGNAGTLVVLRVGSRDAELLAPKFRPMDPAALADLEPLTAWLPRGIGRDRIFVEPHLYEPLGTALLIREQSRQRFGRTRSAIETRRYTAER